MKKSRTINTRYSNRYQLTQKLSSSELLLSRRQRPSNELNLKIFTLFLVEYNDRDFDISLLLDKVNNLIDNLEPAFQTIFLYGNRTQIVKFFEKQNLLINDILPVDEGAYCFIKYKTSILFIFYIIPDELLQESFPISELNRMNYIIRLLIDISELTIPLIPGNEVEWFYQEEGILNPFDKETLLKAYKEGKIEEFYIDLQILSKGAEWFLMQDKLKKIAKVEKNIKGVIKQHGFTKKTNSLFELT